MIELEYSLKIPGTGVPGIFGFYSPDLEGFAGIGHSIEDCLYKAKWGMKEHVRRYLELSRSLSGKIGASLLAIYERVLSMNQVEMHAKKIGALEYFHGMLNKQIDLVERRVTRGEQIPAEEKIHSLFDPHKGKMEGQTFKIHFKRKCP